jgi:hypothetical protein
MFLFWIGLLIMISLNKSISCHPLNEYRPGHLFSARLVCENGWLCGNCRFAHHAAFSNAAQNTGPGVISFLHIVYSVLGILFSQSLLQVMTHRCFNQ